MRWVTVSALVLAVAAAPPQTRPRLLIAVDRVMPSAEIDGPPSERTWDINGRVRAVSCGRARIWVRVADSDDETARAGGWIFASSRPGVALTVQASARCAGRLVRARRKVVVPRRCDGGALRVLSIGGPARWTDGGKWRRLRPGAHVPAGAEVLVRRGWAKLGEPECDGFRMRLFRGSTTVSGYRVGARAPRGLSHGRAVVEVGDARAPGFAAAGEVTVWPRSSCPECGFAIGSVFSVRSSAGRAGVRVYAGSVELRGLERRLLLRAPYQIWIRCRRRCTATESVVWQPRSALTVAPSPARRFRRFVRDVDAPTRLFAPPRASATRTTIARSGGEPPQRVVIWSRLTRISADDFHEEHGVLVWSRAAGGWRLAAAVPAPRGEWTIRPTVADVTGDGHPDVLVDFNTGGSAGCGTRLVLVSTNGVVREALRRSFCEGNAVIENGRLVLRYGEGACPARVGYVHCRARSIRALFRWNGTRLVAQRVTVTCAFPWRRCAR